MSAASFCRSCGKALTDEEKAIAGNVVCAACAPAQASAGPAYQAPPPYYGAQTTSGQPIPGLAFGLGFIPGVGAIYNGQYMKGLVHAVIFGALVTAADSQGDVFGFLIPIFIFYMAFEAYHTAQRRLRGETMDEFSSLVPGRAAPGFPAGPVVLIGLGVLFLLGNLELVRFSQVVKFWPIGLIGLGAYLLYERMNVPQPLPESRQIEAGPTVRNGEGS